MSASQGEIAGVGCEKLWVSECVSMPLPAVTKLQQSLGPENNQLSACWLQTYADAPLLAWSILLRSFHPLLMRKASVVPMPRSTSSQNWGNTSSISCREPRRVGVRGVHRSGGYVAFNEVGRRGDAQAAKLESN
jgi:hypothetical protein